MLEAVQQGEEMIISFYYKGRSVKIPFGDWDAFEGEKDTLHSHCQMMMEEVVEELIKKRDSMVLCEKNEETETTYKPTEVWISPKKES